MALLKVEEVACCSKAVRKRTLRPLEAQPALPLLNRCHVERSETSPDAHHY